MRTDKHTFIMKGIHAYVCIDTHTLYIHTYIHTDTADTFTSPRSTDPSNNARTLHGDTQAQTTSLDSESE
jgi:hypothetical protein